MKKAGGARAYKATRSYDGKTADARREERRETLIETGIQLFGGQGYASVSLNAVCADAGLTKRYFYESFASVEELLAQAFKQIDAELQQEVIQSISAQATPRDMITEGFRSFYQYIQANPERGRVFLVEALAVHSARGKLLGGGGGDVSEFLLSATKSFLSEERLPEAVLTVMAQGAVGAAIFVGQNWIASGYQQPIDELVEGVSEICFGIAARLNVSLDESYTVKQ